MPAPVVGRHVHYVPAGHLPHEQPRAAIIAHVVTDACVNIATFDERGQTWPVLSVPLLQAGDEPPAGGGYCVWPHLAKVTLDLLAALKDAEK